MRSLICATALLLACTAKTPDPGAAPASATSKPVVPASAAPVTAAPVTAAPTTAAPTTAAPTTAAPAAVAPGLRAALPSADRLFTVRLGDAPVDQVLGAWKDRLWAASPEGAQWRIHWVHQGPGVAHRVTAGDAGKGMTIYVAWGVGRGFLQAPLVLSAHDPTTGAATEIFRHTGQRSEAAHLSITEIDGDGKPDLAFAYYESKYMVRPRHVTASGRIIEGDAVRMATSRAYGDLDGDGAPDEVLGRVYGDAKGEPGDLTVRFGKGRVVKVPVNNGVKAVLITRLKGDARDTLYVSDGWLANYGKAARAQLQRVTWNGTTPVVEHVGSGAGEFTFFDLEAIDLDGDGALEIVTRGNKRVTRFDPGSKAPWPQKPLAGVQPVLNVAIGQTPTGWNVYVPKSPAVRVVPVR